MSIPSSIIQLQNTAQMVSGLSNVGSPTPSQYYASVANSASSAATLGQSTDPTAVMSQVSGGFPIIRYPQDGGIYFMALLINNYTRPSMLNPLELQAKTTIVLPVPANLVDSQSITYNPENRAALTGMVADHATGGSASSGSTGGIVGSLGGLAGRTAADLANIVPGAGSTVLQAFGVAPNPWLTVMFTSPAFKEHTLTWRMSPRTPAESAQLKLVINTLKKHSLPSLNSYMGGAFLNYPDIVMPILYPNSTELYLFKYCVITNITVNWAPNGPSFFGGTKAPESVDLTLHMMEIELWMQDDFQKSTMASPL